MHVIMTDLEAWVAAAQVRHPDKLERIKEIKGTIDAELELFLDPKLQSQFQPFEAMNKNEQFEHLRKVHNYSNYWTSKTTKAELESIHNTLHEILDAPEAKLTFSEHVINDALAGRVPMENVKESLALRTGVSTRYTVSLPLVPHTHALVAPDAKVNLDNLSPEMIQDIRDGKKVAVTLNPTERKVLGQLVENDFKALEQQMRSFATDQTAARLQDIDEDWDSKLARLPDYAKEATKLRKRTDDALRKADEAYKEKRRKIQEERDEQHAEIARQATEDGVVLEMKTTQETDENNKTVNVTVFTAQVKGRAEEKEAAKKEIDQQLRRGLMTLNQQRLAAQRQVLLTGVPSAAMAIIETIPSAQALMIEAAKATTTQPEAQGEKQG